MIYFNFHGNLSNNIVLPRENTIEELRTLRGVLIKDPSRKVSSSFVEMALIDEKFQKERYINLSDFFEDDYMFSSLSNACVHLNFRYFYYILGKLSSDYECFVSDVYDKILFKEIESYSIADLENAHRLNTKFGIRDSYCDLLSYKGEADKNAMILQLTNDINKKMRNKE